MVETDWAGLWRQVSQRVRRPEPSGDGVRVDRWEQRAREFDSAVKRKQAQGPDPLLDFVVARLGAGDTALDIGAGTGSFTIPMARVAGRVTAVEPSPSMASVLGENAAEEGLTNVQVVEGTWESVEVEPHDVAVCSHAMYTSPDLEAFVRKMERSARRTCYLLIRVPSHDGVIGEANRRVHGQPYDSPNFVLAYNLLYSVGIYANVLMEPTVRTWANDSLEDALGRAKRHLRLGDDTTHDVMLRELLAQRLTLRDGQYHWPDGMRSALVWWDVPRLST